MNPVLGVVRITWEIHFLMLDFDKIEVILTFNSTFLKINVETFNFFHEENYNKSQCSENITQCLHVQQHKVQYLVDPEFSVL